MRDRIAMWIAWRLPRGLVYWAAIRLMTYRYGSNPDARTCADALDGWQDR